MQKIHFFEFSDLNREPITFSSPTDFEGFCLKHGIRAYAFNEAKANEVAAVCIPETNVVLMKDAESIATSKEVLKKALLSFDFNLQNEKKISGNSNGHDYVEIGGIKWATMNIGANSVTDKGLIFQWGDTQGYTAAQVGTDKMFNWADYKYTNDGGSAMTKYNSTDGKTVLDAEDDAVTAAWGGSWRMPTKEEFAKLRESTSFAWTNDYEGSGVAGLVLTDKTDNSKVLFFPACGSCGGGSVNSVGDVGDYWSSSLFSSRVQSAYILYFNSGGVSWQHGNNRYDGYAVRGVLGRNS